MEQALKCLKNTTQGWYFLPLYCVIPAQAGIHSFYSLSLSKGIVILPSLVIASVTTGAAPVEGLRRYEARPRVAIASAVAQAISIQKKEGDFYSVSFCLPCHSFSDDGSSAKNLNPLSLRGTKQSLFFVIRPDESIWTGSRASASWRRESISSFCHPEFISGSKMPFCLTSPLSGGLRRTLVSCHSILDANS